MTADLRQMNPFDALLWERALTHAGPPRLRDGVHEGFTGERQDQLTVWTIIADDGPAGEQLASAIGRPPVQRAALGPVHVFLMPGEPAYVISVWPTSEQGVFHLIGSVPVTDERWRRIERWVGTVAPRLSPFFLNQADFEGVGSSLAEHGRVEVSRMTARVLRDGSSYSRGWPSGSPSGRPTYRHALAEVEGFASVRTLTLHVGDVLSLHLRRQSGATFYSGSFGLFEDVVLGGLVRAGGQRIDLLTNRARRLNERPPSAIGVRMPTGVLADGEAIVGLLKTLSEQRGTGVAVLHHNPYLHIAITDYLDGSNFDAFVTGTDEVTIFPGYRATIGALTRLTGHLGERFAAREIVDVPAAAAPTREELLNGG